MLYCICAPSLFLGFFFSLSFQAKMDCRYVIRFSAIILQSYSRTVKGLPSHTRNKVVCALRLHWVVDGMLPPVNYLLSRCAVWLIIVDKTVDTAMGCTIMVESCTLINCTPLVLEHFLVQEFVQLVQIVLLISILHLCTSLYFAPWSAFYFEAIFFL